MEVVVALVTVALMPPMYTILAEAVGLKLLPEMVTEDPTGPLAGEKELMTGWAVICKVARHIKKETRYFFIGSSRWWFIGKNDNFKCNMKKLLLQYCAAF
jgi:hypothetical protein